MGVKTYGSAALQYDETGHSKLGIEKMSKLLVLTDIQKVLQNFLGNPHNMA
jgi:hypothetical protein